MNEALRIPVVEALPWYVLARGVLKTAAKRLDRRAAAAFLLLLAFDLLMMWLSELDLMHLDSVRPPEFALSLLFIEALCDGLLVVFVIVADAAVDHGVPRVAAYVLAIVASTALAAWLQWEVRPLLGLRVMTSMADVPRDVAITQPWLVFLEKGLSATFIVFAYVNRRTAQRAIVRMREAQLSRAKAQRHTFESKLQAMQARVEPQFLFNTLAQVRQLYETDATVAGAMLDDLIAYLRAALPHLRESTSTLGKEVDLAHAYLNIMRVRLGDRLAFDFEVPSALREARLPPMILLPLIDHALVYGLGAAQAGGRLCLVTRAISGKLRLSITDTGAGFVPEDGAADLASIGARLHALYGDAAALKLSRMHEHGTEAVMEIPYELAHRVDR